MPTLHHLKTLRSARYYTLGESVRAPSSLWLVLHGYGQLAERFLAKLAALDDGSRLIVAPEGLSRFYVDAITEHRKVGASWMTREDRLNEIEDYVAYLDAVHDAVVRASGAADAKLTVLGFSQGAATAARWAAAGHGRVDRLILWAGVLPPELTAPDAASRLRATRLALVLGDRDPLSQSEPLAPQRAALERAGVPYEILSFEGGHEIDGAMLRRLAAS
jgi:predicted esterase